MRAGIDDRMLERESQLAVLAAGWASAARGHGSAAIVTGEAGAGKTTLVARFAAEARREGDVFTGACDPLFTPRPLGPLLDVLAQMDEPSLSDAKRDGAALFTALIAALGARPRPVAIVFEDVHWADEATLDFVKFLGRRTSRLPVLFVLTYRDDEVGPTHPLRGVLGDLPAVTPRVGVGPLSRDAVAQLATATGGGADALYAATGGNPFFVTEVLAAGGEKLPATVRDAVLVRTSRLSLPAREALDLASLSPVPVEPWLALACMPASAAAFDECVAGGMLRVVDGRYAFRHELARLAIREAVPPLRARALSRRLLEALVARGDPDAHAPRIAHHAEDAGDDDAVLEHSSRAAAGAARVGAHREALAHFARAARHAQRLPARDRSRLLADFARELHTADRMRESVDTYRQAITLAREAGDAQLEGECLTRMATPLMASGHNDEAEQATRASLDLLTPLGPTPALALAFRTQGTLRMLDRDNRAAAEWAAKALELARAAGNDEAYVGTLNTLGSALVLLGHETEGVARLEESRRLGEEAGVPVLVANALGNLGSGLGEVCRLDTAASYLDQGIAYCEAHDLQAGLNYATAWRSLVHVGRGEWTQATDAAERVLARRPSAIARMMAAIALGRVRARRGDPGTWEALDEALALADATQTLQRLGPVRAARAEAAWLEGDGSRAVAEARAAWALALAKDHPWFVGELAYWQWKGGALIEAPAAAAEPYRLQIAGDAKRAALAWRERLCPYEEARALGESDDVDDVKAALLSLERMGARPAAEALRQDLRERGVRAIPRGPRSTTRANRFGLTVRELEVLALLAEGLTNAAIAARLHRAEKTVDHHVSAVLAKLGVGSRDAAARLASRDGLLRK